MKVTLVDTRHADNIFHMIRWKYRKPNDAYAIAMTAETFDELEEKLTERMLELIDRTRN